MNDSDDATPSTTSTVESYVPMPVDALPGIIGQFTTEAAATGCDPACVAVPLLACLASAIGSKRVVRLNPCRIEPATIWAGVIDDGSAQRRIGFEIATAFVQRRQREAFAQHAVAMREYESDMGWYALYLLQWQQFGRKYERPTEPTIPEAERFLVSDIRIDTLVDLLATSPEGLAMLHDDLAGWLDKYDARPDSKGSKLRSMWSGKPLMKDHGRRSIYIEHPSVSMAGGIQPAALRRAFAREDCEDGLIARLLVSIPSSQPIVRSSLEATVSPETEAQLAELFDVLWTMKYHCGANGQPIPSVVELSEEAHGEWIQFSDRHGSEQAELSGYLAGMWASLEAYAARFALVIHICRRAEGQSVDPMLIDAESLRAAVRLADWFGREARRVYTLLAVASDIDDPDERTLALIRRRRGRITARELRQFDRRFRNDAAGAEAELYRLAESNYGHWEAINGGRRRREFVLAPPAKPGDPNGDGKVLHDE